MCCLEYSESVGHQASENMRKGGTKLALSTARVWGTRFLFTKEGEARLVLNVKRVCVGYQASENKRKGGTRLD